MVHIQNAIFRFSFAPLAQMSVPGEDIFAHDGPTGSFSDGTQLCVAQRAQASPSVCSCSGILPCDSVSSCFASHDGTDGARQATPEYRFSAALQPQRARSVQWL